MRIGIDFDNTIICYDKVFCDLAKARGLVDAHYQGNKRELKASIQALPDGDLLWQKLQGKVYGEFIQQAELFSGFREFIAQCNALPNISLFIVSHKTEFGHFDEKRISLRDASRAFLRAQGFFENGVPSIPEKNVFFETTREEKIARIKALNCTHFIDDLVEVLDSPLFPTEIQRFLFQPPDAVSHSERSEQSGESKLILRYAQNDECVAKSNQLTAYNNWTDISYAIFNRST